MPRLDVLGIGENSVDDVYRVASLPPGALSGSKWPITGHSRLFGGQVATTMAACATLGLRAGYVGAFGTDSNGTDMQAALEAYGVEVSGAVVRRGRNRHAVILVGDADGERMVLWERDPEVRVTPQDVPTGLIEDARLLHVDGTDVGTSIDAAQRARAAGIPVTIDVDTVTDETRALIDLATAPILTQGAVRELTGEHAPAQALRTWRREHPGLLCVTLGEHGALLLDGDTLHASPGFEIDAVDTTGAGDVFRAGFIVALLRGDPPPEILRFACAAAAVSCTRRGAMNGAPTQGEVRELLKSRPR